MVKVKPVYTSVFEPDGGRWLVSVPEVPGAHSHGRTVARGRANIREAVALVLNVAEDSFELEEEFKLPARVRHVVDRARRARSQAHEAETKALDATREAVGALDDLSVRDVAELVGVSFQRIQQLRKLPPLRQHGKRRLLLVAKYRFRIGNAYPGNQSVAVWITGIGMILNDLVLANGSLNDAFEAAGEGVSPEGLYFFRVVASHYREACKFLQIGEKDPDISAFVRTLSPEAQALAAKVRQSSTPWRGSFVETKLKRTRDFVFHYLGLTGGEIQAALEELKDTESSVAVTAQTLRGMRMLWADEVANYLAFGHLGGAEGFRQVVNELRELVLALIGFSHRAIGAYLESLPSGTITKVED
jgi:predicted RNase H-like HicB family nuclease